jgi:hypothetical protein
VLKIVAISCAPSVDKPKNVIYGRPVILFLPIMKSILFPSIFALALSSSLLCGQEAAAPTPAAPAKETKAAELKAGEFTLKADAAWALKPEARMMSVGGFSYLKEGKPLMDADVYYFGEGQGGNVDSNINRWQSQFKPGADGKPVAPKLTNLKYGEEKVILVELEGVFMSGSMFGPKTEKEGQRMLGAILDHKKGSVFIKMVGADADMKSAAGSFRKLIDSAYAVPGTEVKAEK